MSNPNTERDERVREIRERRHAATLPANQRGLLRTASWVDIDYLLSRLDEQQRDSIGLEYHSSECGIDEDCGYECTCGAERRNQAYLTQHHLIADAATAMRDRCVDAIKTLRATPHGAAYNNAINDAIHKVESLTLEGEQEKQT